MKPVSKPRTIVLGGGLAGLTTSDALAYAGYPVICLEGHDEVGGLARNINFHDHLFDIGGHRFFTKVTLVEQMWREVLAKDLLTRQRLSRIYYKSRFFRYPLEPRDALRGLGVLEAMRCGMLPKATPSPSETRWAGGMSWGSCPPRPAPPEIWELLQMFQPKSR